MTMDAARPDKAPDKGIGTSVAGWPLRRKIALALAIPLLLAATLGGLRVQSDLADSNNAARSAEQVKIIEPAVAYLTASETAMVAAQSNSAAAQGDLFDAIDDIASAANTLKKARDNANLDDLQTAHVNALLDLSQALRGVDADSLGPATWVALVRQLESSVSQLVTSVNAAQTTPEPRLEQLSQAMSGRLSLAMQQGLVTDTELAQSGSQELFSEIGVEASAIDRLAGSVDGAEDLTAQLRTANTRHATQIRDNSATTLDGPDAYAPYDQITTKLLSGVTKSLTSAASDAQRSALLGALLILAALAAAIGLAAYIARSLLDPIGRVREGALAVARHRLPDAVARIRAGEQPEPITLIDVTTDEEIGQVARAVDDLHRQAIHLASGEAQLRLTVNAMFVTLSRRSNSLVNQQLAQIERLEHNEEDPKRLESLFRLDHLASRMRRTADSLLILADAPSRAAGQLSLTVSEALQAASSGVQDYKRVEILSHISTRISDDAAADVVHLLTELVDNALNFSPPSEPVRLAARLGVDGATLTVTDSGLGVPASELEQLNADLVSGAEATPETARRMGLFVVSRLAARHGVLASLARNPGGGTTATIVLPTSILPDLHQTDAPVAASAEAATVPAESVHEAVHKAVHEAVHDPMPSTEPSTVPSTVSSKMFGTMFETISKTMSKTKHAEVGEHSKRHSRSRARAEKAANKAAAAEAKTAERAAAAEAKAVERAAAAEAKTAERAAATEARAAERAAAAEARTAAAEVDLPSVPPALEPESSEPTPARPSLDSLLPRREPGANLPRTGPDAFLPPETSGAIGPLFSRRTPAAAAGSGTPAGVADALEPAESTEPQKVVPEQVASVVPINALASRQRAQAEEEARAFEEAPTAEAEPATESEREPEAETETELETELETEPETETDTETDTETAPAAAYDSMSGVDVSDPLGLGTTTVGSTNGNKPAPQPDVRAPAASQPAAAAAGINGGLNGALHTRTRGAAGDAPIFKSMRSGWLAGEGEGEFHETEVDRGWEIAEHVADETQIAESTPSGLPRRAPGERLVPGSVTPPEAAKTRDPDAIRRRLQAHTAGVSRGRRAAQNTSQHTEAGPS